MTSISTGNEDFSSASSASSAVKPQWTSLPQRWGRGRRAPVARVLLVGIGKPQERRLVPRPPEELQPGGQHAAAGVTHRHRDGRKAGARRKQLVVVAAGRVEIADQPR